MNSDVFLRLSMWSNKIKTRHKSVPYSSVSSLLEVEQKAFSKWPQNPLVFSQETKLPTVAMLASALIEIILPYPALGRADCWTGLWSPLYWAVWWWRWQLKVSATPFSAPVSWPQLTAAGEDCWAFPLVSTTISSISVSSSDDNKQGFTLITCVLSRSLQ